MVATTQRAESIANVIPNHQSNKPAASDIHHHQHGCGTLYWYGLIRLKGGVVDISIVQYSILSNNTFLHAEIFFSSYVHNMAVWRAPALFLAVTIFCACTL